MSGIDSSAPWRQRRFRLFTTLGARPLALVMAMNARINRMDRRFQICSVLATVVFMLLALWR